VRPSEFIISTTFRWALIVSGVFMICMLLLFGFVYLRTATYLLGRVHASLTEELNAVESASPEERPSVIARRLQKDPHRVWVIGLFDGSGRIAGNVETLPTKPKADAESQNIVVDRIDARGRERQPVLALVRALPDGATVVIGRNVDEVTELTTTIEEALALGLLPALLLAIGVGVLLSVRAQERLETVTLQMERIIAGDLKQRLPIRGRDDPFDRLSGLVNHMLEEIEALIRRVAGVSDDIAHDLRTPLTRARVRLERGRDNAQTLDELRAVVDSAIGGLDQSLAVVTALLRIAEIEHSRRLQEFGDVALGDLVRQVGDLYEPIAEDRNVTLRVDPGAGATVRGDRDLLLEAFANLVDNAIKFAPSGGQVDVSIVRRTDEDVMRVKDNGPGISESDRETVVRRFYRSDKSRQTEGFGLGLSLVMAIVKLHGFRLSFGDGPGCVAEISCPRGQHRGNAG